MTVPDANVRATFSESINPSTTDPTTFTLVRMGTATSVGAVVSYDSAAGKAVLDPSGELVSGAAYAATVKGGNGGVQDPAGNTLAVDKVCTFTVADIAKPGGTALINNGATYTKSRAVSVELSAKDPTPASEVTEMRFSNDERIWAPWRAYAFTKNWTLTGGAGTKNVDVQFRDRAGNVSTITTDSIIHRPITVAKEVVHVREAADAQKPATGGKAVAAAVKLPDSGGPALLPPIAGLLLVGAGVVRLLAGLIGKPSRNQA